MTSVSRTISTNVAEPTVTQCKAAPVLQSQLSRNSKGSSKSSVTKRDKAGKSSISSSLSSNSDENSDTNSTSSDDEDNTLSNVPISIEPSTSRGLSEIRDMISKNKSKKYTEEQIDQIKLASEILDSGISWLQKVATHIFDPSKTCTGKCKLHCLRAIHKMTKKPRGKPPKRLKKEMSV